MDVLKHLLPPHTRKNRSCLIWALPKSRKARAGPAKHGHKRTNMQYLWTFKTLSCVLKLKWASTSEQETISSSPTQKFGCLPRNLNTGAGLSAAPARQLHLDTTLHGNAQDKPRQTGWADVINGGGARKWSLLTRCSKEIPLSKAAQEAGLLESYLSRANRSHGHPRSLTWLRTKQLKLPPLLLLGGNGYNSLKFSPMTASSLCNNKRKVDEKLKEIDVQQINLTIKWNNPKKIVTKIL